MEKLINQKQPFGEVHNVKAHPESMPYVAPVRNRPGSTSEVTNHGHNHAVSNANKAPQALARASQGKDNAPFAWTGHPVRK